MLRCLCKINKSLVCCTQALEHLNEIAKQKGLDKLQSSRGMSQGLISIASNDSSAVIVEVSFY